MENGAQSSTQACHYCDYHNELFEWSTFSNKSGIVINRTYAHAIAKTVGYVITSPSFHVSYFYNEYVIIIDK